MIMDECPKKSNDYDLIKKSMDLSLYWAERSKKSLEKNPNLSRQLSSQLNQNNFSNMMGNIPGFMKKK